MSAISERFVEIINELEPEGDIDSKLEHILENELIRRLSRYELINKRLSEKYGMSFDEFKKNRIVEQRNYSFEVESDFWNWEVALDGIETIQRRFEILRKH